MTAVLIVVALLLGLAHLGIGVAMFRRLPAERVRFGFAMTGANVWFAAVFVLVG